MTAGGKRPLLLDILKGKKDRGKTPASENVLASWLAAFSKEAGVTNDRMEWLVASTVVTAVLQRVVLADGSPRFVLKGGTYINYRLGWQGRTTKDVDGIVRGDIDDFVRELDKSLRLDWAPFELKRGAVELIKTPDKDILPRRMDISLVLKGKTWRRIKVEISPDEAQAGSSATQFTPANLKPFGIDSPAALLGISLEYQIAQKLHACTGAHAPPRSTRTIEFETWSIWFFCAALCPRTRRSQHRV